MIKKIYKNLYFFTFLLSIFLLNTEAFARVFRVSKCTLPFDFTIGSVCVLGSIGLTLIGGLILFVIMFGFNIVIAIIKAIFRKIFK
jgi:hypothetical protein